MAESKKAKPKKKETPHSKGYKKETREKIMAAARNVFCNYPYYSASIRTIGKLAKIEHPLISYYFPNKAELFSSVLEEVIIEYLEAEKQMLDSVKSMNPKRGLSLFLDLQLDYYREHPENFRMIALNMVQSIDDEPIPGYDLIQKTINQSMNNFKQIAGIAAPEHEVEMFSRSVLSHMINFLGASTFHAALMNMNPDSFQYLNWVKETIIFAILPRLELLVRQARDANSGD